MSILTLATYKSLTGTTSAVNDTLINSLIAPVQDQIEQYTDRKFDAADYFEWFPYTSNLFVKQFPINYVKYLGYSAYVAQFDSDDYNYQITPTGIVVTSSVTFTSTTFLFATYANLTLLKTAIELALPAITLTIQAGYETMNYRLLKLGTGRQVYGAEKYDITTSVDNSESNFVQLQPGIGDAYPIAWGIVNDRPLLLVYNGGYAYADMPSGLQLIMANVIKEIVSSLTAGGSGSNSSGSGITGIYKSESIGDYSYTLADGGTTVNGSVIGAADVAKFVSKFSDDLYVYKKKII